MNRRDDARELPRQGAAKREGEAMSWSIDNFRGCDRFDGPDSRITDRLPRGDNDDEPGLEPPQPPAPQLESFHPQGMTED